MTDPNLTPPNLRELSKKGYEFYKSIPQEEIDAHNGQHVAIELDTGEYFFGETKELAVESARKKHPHKLVFIRRVGNIEKVSLHSRLHTGSQSKPYARLF